MARRSWSLGGYLAAACLVAGCSAECATPVDPEDQLTLMTRTFLVATGRGSGTGFVIGKHGDDNAWLLTAAHVVEGQSDCRLIGLGEALKPCRWPGRVVAIDTARDLALLAGPAELASRGGIDATKSEVAGEGQRLLVAGFPEGFFATTSLVARDAKPSREGRACATSAVEPKSAGVAGGSSGSAVVDGRLRLIGVIVAVVRDTRTGEERAEMVSAAEVRGFLQDTARAIRERREALRPESRVARR